MMYKKREKGLLILLILLLVLGVYPGEDVEPEQSTVEGLDHAAVRQPEQADLGNG